MHKIPGKINLHILGFQHNINGQQVADIVTALPAYHYAGLSVIEYDPQRKQQAEAPYWQRRCKGEFIQHLRKVVIYQYNDITELKHILYHEIAHYMFYLILDSKDKKRWVTQLHKQEPCISDVAKQNASEDFAECYAAYLLNSEMLQKLPSKHHFFTEVIFQHQL